MRLTAEELAIASTTFIPSQYLPLAKYKNLGRIAPEIALSSLSEYRVLLGGWHDC